MRSQTLYTLQAGLSNLRGKVVRYPSKVKEGRFTVGKVTGNKFDPFQVAADMRVARDEQAAGSFAQEIALTNNKLHRRNPTTVRHRCAQRCDSDGADSNFTALTVTALGHQWL